MDRKNMLWQNMRKKLKREYNRQKTQYDEWTMEWKTRVKQQKSKVKFSANITDVEDVEDEEKGEEDEGEEEEEDNDGGGDGGLKSAPPRGMGGAASSSTGHLNQAVQMFPPVEADYAAIEKEHFGLLTEELLKLKELKHEVYSLTDKAIQSLRYACVNISQRVRYLQLYYTVIKIL